MRVPNPVWLFASVIGAYECYAVTLACEIDIESVECFDTIEIPLAEIAKTAVGIPFKLTLNSARDPMTTLKGAMEFLRQGGRSSMAVMVEAMSSLSFGMEAFVERSDPGAASSEVVLFVAQAVRLIVTRENFTDNPLLRESISSITPDLLYISGQALKVVNRMGGPRRYFFLPVLYLNEVALTFLMNCKTTDYPPADCEIMQRTLLKLLDVIEGIPLIVKSFGRPLKDFLEDED